MRSHGPQCGKRYGCPHGLPRGYAKTTDDRRVGGTVARRASRGRRLRPPVGQEEAVSGQTGGVERDRTPAMFVRGVDRK